MINKGTAKVLSVTGCDNRRTRERIRSRSLCVLAWESDLASGRVRDISGAGAFIETNHRPPLGTIIEMRHPLAGAALCEVVRHGLDGIAVSFTLGESAVRFALSVVASAMTEGAPAPLSAQSAGGL